MANLGIGLGGFASGFERGFGLGERIEQGQQKRKQRKAMESIETEGRAEFDKQGGGDWDAFHSRVVVPRKAAALLEAGDYQGASAWTKWAESDTTKRASRLFSSGMLKGQHGDMKGAISDFVQAGKTQGYGPDITINEAEERDDGTWQITGKTADGKAFVQNFTTPEEVMQFGATYLNPEAAFESWQASQQAESEFNRDMAKEREKSAIGTERKMIERDLGLGGGRGGMDHSKAHDLLKDSPDYMAASPDERRAMRETEIRASSGQTQAAPTVRFNPQTGEIDESGQTAPQPAQPQPGAPQPGAAYPDAVERRPVPAPQPGTAQAAPRPEVVGIGPAPQAQQEMPAELRPLIEQAREMLRSGTSSAVIVDALRKAGVPQQFWPPELTG